MPRDQSQQQYDVMKADHQPRNQFSFVADLPIRTLLSWMRDTIISMRCRLSSSIRDFYACQRLWIRFYLWERSQRASLRESLSVQMTLLWSGLELRQVSTYSSSKRILTLQWLRQLLSRSQYSFILVMQQSFSRLNSFLSSSNMPCRLSSLDLFVFSFAQASSACQSSSICDRYYFSRFQYSSMRWSLLVSDRQCSSMASQSNLILLVISSITSYFRASILLSLPFSCCSSWTFASNCCQALLGLALSFLCLMLECDFCRWCQRQGDMYLLTGDLELDLLCQSGDLERGGYFVGVGFSLMDLKQCSVLMRFALFGDLDFCFLGSAMLIEGMEEIMKLLLDLGYCGSTVALSCQLVLILSFLAFEPCTRQTVQPSPQMKSASCSF